MPIIASPGGSVTLDTQPEDQLSVRYGARTAGRRAPVAKEMIDATRIPIVASSWAAVSSNASPLMNSDTVKPIPANVPTPTICRAFE
jgi:hypothetical protein